MSHSVRTVFCRTRGYQQSGLCGVQRPAVWIGHRGFSPRCRLRRKLHGNTTELADSLNNLAVR